MRYIIGFVFCGLLAVGNGYYCSEERECDEDECCVAYYAANFVGLGTCVKLGRAGAPCNEDGAKLDYYGGKYLSKCPCKSGLVCIETVQSGTPLQIDAGRKCRVNKLFGESILRNSTRVKTGINKHQ